jgi:ribosomal protein L11 methylase PrmA
LTLDNSNTGSFRDPGGQIFTKNGRIYRTITRLALEDFEQVEKTGLFEELTGTRDLVGYTRVKNIDLGPATENAELILEHNLIPFISYPYEWSFSQLKVAALLHLDIQIKAFDKKIVLSDATAYNVQFIGNKPIFIDHLSFKPYQDGQFWLAHKQFCEQFLNPLLLRSYLGITHNSWFRGSLEGIDLVSFNAILPWYRKFNFQVLTNVVLPAVFEKRAISNINTDSNSNQKLATSIKNQKLPASSYKNILLGLRRLIHKLQPKGKSSTVWSEYANSHSYKDAEFDKKRAFVQKFSSSIKPEILWDIGCNVGDFSKFSLEAGTKKVIGFEYDFGVLENAYSRSISENLDFLPLHLDAANPTPSQGWNQQERFGLNQRRNADAVIALAVIHHLCIGRNIPLKYAVDWIVGHAANGVIEFVPKNDPMVQELLSLRQDIFDNYTVENFTDILAENAVIKETEVITENGRTLFWFASK